MSHIFKHLNKQQLYEEIQETLCLLDDQHPQEPRIKRLFALTYDLGQRLHLVKDS